MMNRKKSNRKIERMLELPKEIYTSDSKIYITGSEEAIVQNIKGILEYDERYISIGAYNGVINIYGKSLKLENMMDESLKIRGSLDSIEFEKIE